MSIKVMSAIWETSPSKENKLLALLAIADNADDDGWAWPSQNTLAKKCRVKRRAMQKILDTLETDGEVVIYNRVDPKNRQQHFSNVYHLAKYGKVDAEAPQELRGFIKPHVLPPHPSVQTDATGGDVQKDTTVVYDYALPDVQSAATVAYPETHESLQETPIEPSEIKEQQQAQPASAEIAHSPLQQAAAITPTPVSQAIPSAVVLPSPPVPPPPSPRRLADDEPLPEQPTIYGFYVDNMRQQVTGIIRDKLVDAVKEFGEKWVEDAITEAVTHNAKTWAYIQSILDRWAKDGKGAARPSSVKGAGLPQSPAVIVKQYTEDIDPDSVFAAEVKRA